MSKVQNIRAACIALFAQLVTQRATLGDKAFRKQVILGLVENTGCTISAASTHYNFAFQKAKQETPELVVGLGRPPEKNNGGRKPKQTPVAAPAAPLVGAAALLANFQRALGGNAAPAAAEGAQAPVAPVPDAVAAPAGDDLDPMPVEQQVFDVKRSKGGETVATGLSLEDARAMVEKAAAGKKAKLYWI